MKELQERIKKDGIAVNEDILKVDSFINHQVDPVLMQHIGEAFAEHFKDQGITKVATIESSGIAPALMTAMCMGLPMIILKKQPSKILNDNLFQTEVTSFTKGTSYELTLSSKFVSEKDHVLIIDGFSGKRRSSYRSHPSDPQSARYHCRCRCPDRKSISAGT